MGKGITFEKEIWERTEITDTFNPEIMWKEFKHMQPLAQTDWINKNPASATKMFWYLEERYEGGIYKEQTIYTIVVDYGKPYDIKVSNEEQLKKELKHLKELYDSGEYPHFDVWIYDKNNKDVTSEVFKRYAIRYIS